MRGAESKRHCVGKIAVFMYIIISLLLTPDVANAPLCSRNVDGGPPFKVLDVPSYAMRQIRWTADATSLTYVETRDEVSNIWSLPIDGALPKRLTDFKSDRIFSFAWSHDGKRLVYARGNLDSDVVLINDFK
jgi:Tol biopolymer transport system component